MSFLKYNSTICEGDTVILYLGHNNMHSIVVTAGKVHQTKFGAFPHSDMVGKQFGSKVFSSNTKGKKGYLFLLHPTPELWTINLPHRTQILYSTDISMVLMQLDIKPGSVVMESGTGSASMSHALIRSIAPTGHLYTYEFHEERSKQARKEFIDHNVDHLVTVTHRNVTADGFLEENIADAVFLDLPSPWDAIKFSKKALKREGGRLCSFSPCIEQVQKTCGVMRDNGFRDIQVMECLLKTFDVKTVSYQMPDFGEKLSEEPTRKRKFEALENECCVQMGDITTDVTDSTNRPCNTQPSSQETATNTCSENFRVDKLDVLTARPLLESPGHTGFLTFASLFPEVQ